MSPDQIENARRAVERVRDDLGENKVRAGRDHDVLEAARWAAMLMDALALATEGRSGLRGLVTMLERNANAVRKLHRQVEEGECGTCGVKTPCPTSRALDPHVVTDEVARCDDPRCAEIPVGRCLLCRSAARVR